MPSLALTPELLALGASACLALAHTATKAGVTALSSTGFLAIRWSLSVGLMAALWTATGAWAGFHVDRAIWTLLLAALLGSVVGWTLYSQAVARLDVSLAHPISQTASLVSVATAIAALGERPGPFTLVGALGVAGGIFLLYHQSGRGHQSGPRAGSTRAVSLLGLGLAAGTALMWGLGNVFWKLALADYTVEQGVFARALVPMLVALAVVAHRPAAPLPGLRRRGLAMALATAALGDLLGFGLKFLALRQGSVSTVIPIVYSSPLFVALFSRQLLGEQVTRWRLLGITALVLGVTLVALPSR